MLLTRAVLYDTEGQRPLAQADKHVTRFERTERLDQLDELTFRIMRGQPGWEAYSRRRLLKLDFGTNAPEWWRIIQVSDQGSERIQLVMQPRYADLRRDAPFLQVDGRKLMRVVVTGLTPAQALTRLLTDIESAPNLYTPGEVDDAFADERVYVWGEGSTYWRLLHDVVDEQAGGLAGARLAFEWTGSEYAVHIRERSGREEQVTFTNLKTGLTGKSLSFTTTDRDYYSRIFPVGGPENETITIAQAAWPIESGTYDVAEDITTFDVGRTLVWEDGALVGEAARIDGELYDVAHTKAPNTIAVHGQCETATSLRFVQVDGSQLTTLKDRTAERYLDTATKPVRYSQVSPYRNLFVDAGIADQADTLAGWNVRGNAVASLVTDTVSTEHGNASIRVEASERGFAQITNGLITNPIPIDLDERGGPYVSAAVNLRVISGAIGIRMIDADGNAFPSESDAIVGREDTIRGYKLGGFEPTTGPVRLFIFAREDNTVFHVDAAAVTRSGQAQPYSPLMGPNALWDVAMRELRNTGGIQPPQAQVSAFTVTDMPGVKRTLHIGDRIRVRTGDFLRMEDARLDVLTVTEELSVGHEADEIQVTAGSRDRSFAVRRKEYSPEPPPPESISLPPLPQIRLEWSEALGRGEATLSESDPTWDRLITFSNGSFRRFSSHMTELDNYREHIARSRVISENGQVAYADARGFPGAPNGYTNVLARFGISQIDGRTVTLRSLVRTRGSAYAPGTFTIDGQTATVLYLDEHTFTIGADGTYTATHDATNEAGDTHTRTIDLDVEDGVTVDMPTVNLQSTRIGPKTFEFRASPGGLEEDGYVRRYFWWFDEGEPGAMDDAEAAHIFPTVTEPTVYTVQVFFIDNRKYISDTASVDVEVLPEIDS